MGSTLLDAGRTRARTLLSRGGSRVAGLDRRRAPHRMILRAVPLALNIRFDAASAHDLDAVLELRVRDPGGGRADEFELRIFGGRCEVRPGPARHPGAGVLVGAGDMIRMASGAVGWPELLSAGRLELSGDPFLALRFPNLFRLPATRPETNQIG
ncbi:MAG: SCP2 sterol-binding domain-containing protein [Actinomycetota bacterium]|nr:SCP2 sterol-binding domain-containing protein [Actinomycetota bacterium]